MEECGGEHNHFPGWQVPRPQRPRAARAAATQHARPEQKLGMARPRSVRSVRISAGIVEGDVFNWLRGVVP